MNPGEIDFLKIIETLAKHDVEFIIVGGVCAALHGAPVTTFDLDIVHKRSQENIEKILDALSDLQAYYRTKEDVRIEPEGNALLSAGHHLLMTNAGPLDLLGTIGQSEDYDDLLNDIELIEIAGRKVRLQSLENLIRIKYLLASQKDKAVIPILERTLEEKKKRKKI